MDRSIVARSLAEFGVIVLGVLTALALESAWQSWQDASLGAEYLTALRLEAEENVSRVRRSGDGARLIVSSLEDLAAAIDGSEMEGREREWATVLQRATRTSHDIDLRRAVFNDLESTGNLRLLPDPALRQRVAGRYSSDLGHIERMNASADRLGSGLYHLVSGYEVRHGLSGAGIPAETSDRAAEFLRQVISDPAFQGELSREFRRHAIAQFYLQRLLSALEDYVIVLQEAQAR